MTHLVNDAPRVNDTTAPRTMNRRAALASLAVAPLVSTAALAVTTADPAVVAHDRLVIADGALNAELDRINDIYPDHEQNNDAIEALNAGPIGQEADDAFDAAINATPTTIAGIACKARAVARSQGIDLDEAPDNKWDGWFHQLIADIDRMAGEAA